MVQSRRDVLKGLGAAILSAGTLGCDVAAADDTAILAIDHAAKGTPVSPNFVGLSFETAALAETACLRADNRSLVALVKSLGRQGVIRLGGNSSDRPRQRPSSGAIGHLAGFLKATGWSLIYGLNLGTGSPAEAADEAEDVMEFAGAATIAFQIGNEPDLYDRGLRHRDWNPEAYLAEWRRYADAILDRVPRARFAGPDVGSQPGWLVPFASLHDHHVSLLTRHYYGDGPAWSPLVSIDSVFRSDASLARIIKGDSPAAASAGLPIRMSEVNSVYGGGKHGVSDTLAAAVWGVDLMFQLAQAGWQGVNFHGGSPAAAYSPILLDPKTCDTRPLYYGMALFAKAAPNLMLPVRLSERQGLRGYALKTHDGHVRVALINKSLTQPVRVAIDSAVAATTMFRLSGPDPAGAAAITSEELTATPADEAWRVEAIATGSDSTIDVAPCSAVLAELLNPRH